ncbi:transcriptional regulator [Aeromonas veronii]
MVIFKLNKDSGDLSDGIKRLGRLNSSESEVLVLLYQNKGNLVSKDSLLDAGWPNKIVTPNSLNMAVKNIRVCFEKLNIDDVIITHVKKGFSWNPIYGIDISTAPTKVYSNKLESFSQVASSVPEHVNVSLKDELSSNSRVDEVDSADDLNRIVNFRNLNLSIRKKIEILFFYCLVAATISIVFFYYTYWTSISCYHLNGSNFCGVGEFKESTIPSDIENGNYLFGYTKPDGDFYYVKN